jgi:hypothetical protein
VDLPWLEVDGSRVCNAGLDELVLLRMGRIEIAQQHDLTVSLRRLDRLGDAEIDGSRGRVFTALLEISTTL